jgi:hypothetical protein
MHFTRQLPGVATRLLLDARIVVVAKAMMVATILIAGCTNPAAVDTSSLLYQAVVQFHDDYNSGNYARIYENSRSIYKAQYSADSYAQLLAAFRSEDGKLLSTTRLLTSVKSRQGDLIVTGIYKSTFEHKIAQENFAFVYRRSSRRMQLAAYERQKP